MKIKLTIIIVCLVVIGVCFGTQFINLIPLGLNTISVTTCRAPHSCNGSSTEFTFSFPIIETNDLIVLHRINSTGVTTVLTEGAGSGQYAVSATNNDFSNGGTVTTVSTYASGISLILLRDTDMTQQTDLEDSGVLRLEALEDQLDKMTMIIQELQEELNRCLKYPRSDSSDLSAELPNSIDRASKTLVFDANSEPDVE